MTLNCAVLLRWDSTPAQRRVLGAALWRWCQRAAGRGGMYSYLDNQAFADLLAGRLPASPATAWDAGLPRVPFAIPGDPNRDGAATLDSLRRALPGEGIVEIRVEFNSDADKQTSRQADKTKDGLDSVPLSDSEEVRLSTGMWLMNLLAVVAPLLSLVAAALFLWGGAFNWGCETH